MRLGDFLTPALAIVPLDATTVTEAATLLVTRLTESGLVGDADRLRRRIVEDRAEDTAAFGERAFVLHYRTDAARGIGVALGTSIEPVRRRLGDGDGQLARVVVVVVAPPGRAAQYLQIVGGIARTVSRADVVEEMLQQSTAEQLVALPRLAELELATQLTVGDLMTDDPRVTRADALVRDAAVEMLEAGLGALPVVDDDDRLVGLLGDRDLLRDLLTSVVLGSPIAKPPARGSDRRRHVRDIMTRQVLCVAPEQPLAEVVSLMVNKNVERVPVVRQGRLVGFLTRGDILRQLIGP